MNQALPPGDVYKSCEHCGDLVPSSTMFHYDRTGEDMCVVCFNKQYYYEAFYSTNRDRDALAAFVSDYLKGLVK